jgi:hypothetical protein
MTQPRFPRPAGRRPEGGGNRRRHVLLAAAAAVGLLAAALLLAQIEGLFGPKAAPGEAEIYGGTIQLATSGANFCRRLSFDNRNGDVLDRGFARCGPTAPPPDGSGDRQPVGSNLDQIRAGFLRR